VLITGSIDYAGQGKVINQVQGPSRESSLEQEEMRLETQLQCKSKGLLKEVGHRHDCIIAEERCGCLGWSLSGAPGQRVCVETPGEATQRC